jgi:hypothetical protein
VDKLRKPGWTTVTHDAYITHHPAYLCCVVLTVEDSGDYIDVFEGSDALSGRKVLRLKALANRSVSFNFTTPIYCERGISVDFSTTDSEATIVWLAANRVKPEQELVERSIQ